MARAIASTCPPSLSRICASRPVIGLELLEGQHLHLAHIFVHPHPFREGGVDIHGFARDAAAFVLALDEVEGTHVVQPVGQLDQQHAQVLAHRQQELAQVLGGAFALAHRLDLRQLGDAIDQPGNVGAEQPFDVLDRRQRILDRVVEQRGDDRFLIKLQLGHQPGHFDRMAEIGVAAGALLAAVLLHGVDIGPVQQHLVRIRIIGFYPFDKFILTQHPPNDARCGPLWVGGLVKR